jgi:hypothetical protein
VKLAIFRSQPAEVGVTGGGTCQLGSGRVAAREVGDGVDQVAVIADRAGRNFLVASMAAVPRPHDN